METKQQAPLTGTLGKYLESIKATAKGESSSTPPPPPHSNDSGSGNRNPSQGSGGQGGGGGHGGSGGHEPARTPRPSKKEADQKPWWERLFKAAIVLVLAVGSVYFYTHDTPPLRAANEKVYMESQAQVAQTENKVAVAKEETKQLKIKRDMLDSQIAAGVTPAQSVPLPVTPAPVYQHETPLLSPSKPVVNIVSGQHILSTNWQFKITGPTDTETVGRFLLPSIPKSITGAYKLVLESDPSQTVWSKEWSTEESSDIQMFLSQNITTKNYLPTDSVWIHIYTRGPVYFIM